jgi:hypothetical protein
MRSFMICALHTIYYFGVGIGGGGHNANGGDERNEYNILAGNPEWKRSLGRPKCKWEDNIKMNLMEIGLGFVNWSHMAQDRDLLGALVSSVM